MARQKKEFPNPSKAAQPFRWMSTNSYATSVALANETYDFGFSDGEIQSLRGKLKNLHQSDNLNPIGIFVWQATDLSQNWNLMLDWMSDQANSQGVTIGDCFYDVKLSFSKEALVYSESRSILRPVSINLVKSEFSFTNPVGAWEARPLGIEFLAFLATNPHIMRLLDYKTLPNVRLPGLRINESYEPVIGYKDGSLFMAFDKA